MQLSTSYVWRILDIYEYHQDFKSIANFKVLKRMINVMMCYCVLFFRATYFLGHIERTFNVKFPKLILIIL